MALAVLAGANPAAANAWGRDKGKGQTILKVEAMRATQGLDPDGQPADLPREREELSVGTLVEYGLSDRITIQFKGDWQSGEDAFVDYEGRGPLEIGASWRVWRDDRTSVSLYGAYASGGEGRNAGYALPGQGESDWEVRGAVGRSFTDSGWLPAGFAEVQVARRMRSGLPDETRIDATVGTRFARGWLALGQIYAGRTDGGGAEWTSVETSVVRDLGDWSLQAGWRETVAGREIPLSSGPVLALWRRF